MTQREVATKLGWSPSKIIRLEQGENSISVADLWALLKLYQIDDPGTVSILEQMARGSRKLPFSEYADVMTPETLRYVRYEASATLIRQFAFSVIPGLLQTDAYARALFHTNQISEERAAKLLESRRERRALLAGDDAPEAYFIIDEGAMRRVIGDRDVLGGQLDHLAKMAEQPRIKVQVLPFENGALGAATGSFNLLEFANDDDPDFLFFESPRGDVLYLDESDVTSTHRLRFWEMEDLASEVDDFARFAGPA